MTEEKEVVDTNGQENKEEKTKEKDVSDTNGQEKKEENDPEEKTELESSIIRQVEYYFGMSWILYFVCH